MDKQKWQQAYEPAPERFTQSIADALLITREEQQPMKRMTIRTIAIVAVLLVLLAGAALAVAGHTGVMDFLFPDKQAEIPITVQTALPQQGGSLQTMDVTVRDAVSDGLSTHLAVAFSVHNPESEAVLIDFDYARLFPTDGQQAAPYTGEDGQGLRRPYTAAVMGAEDVYVVCTTMAWADGKDLVTGENWFYESPGVLVVEYILDLRDNGRYSESGGIQSVLDTPQALVLTPSIVQVLPDGRWETIETGNIDVEVVHTSSELEKYITGGLPIQGEGFTITAAEITTSPLATYVSLACDFDADTAKGWDFYQYNMWMDILDSEGKPLRLLSGHNMAQDEGDMSARLELVYESTSVDGPWEITPWSWTEDGREKVYAAPISIQLEAVGGGR